ncbi:MAG: hypothetical protein KDE68_08460 [Rhodocyclaceae bacterium]|nr:hypothetical protein [Rhodocyclaceae bacterium]
MTHTPNLPTESNLIKTEHEVHFYVERAHQLREQAMSEMIADGGHAIAQAYHAAAGWLAQRLHLSAHA